MIDKRMNNRTQDSPVDWPTELAFVVQFANGARGEGDGYQGRAEHVRSGRCVRFRSRDELIEFLDGCLANQCAVGD